MADRWMDERERREREDRDWRNQGRTSRDMYNQRSGSGGRYGEDRSFDRGYEGDGGYEGGRDAVFGERESGANYGGRTGPGVRQGGGSGGGSGWQNPNYGGVSPAMRQGEYSLEQNRQPRFQSQDYTRGGRYYGDDNREPIYREEWSQGRRDTGAAPRGYDAGYSESRDRYHREGYGQPGFSERDYRDEMRRGSGAGYARNEFSGGTGGYDYERGYGDAGRDDGRSDRGQRFEDAGRNAGDFFHRAGQRMAEWFGGSSDNRTDERDQRGARGKGPQGYKRSDERISDDANERLTDDGWLDASNVSVSVSGGELTLSGTVESREAKHRAERIVEDISGVNHVQNNLRIAKTGFLRSDSTGYGDSVAEAQMRRDNPTATSTTGEGGGQSTAGKKQ